MFRNQRNGESAQVNYRYTNSTEIIKGISMAQCLNFEVSNTVLSNTAMFQRLLKLDICK